MSIQTRRDRIRASGFTLMDIIVSLGISILLLVSVMRSYGYVHQRIQESELEEEVECFNDSAHAIGVVSGNWIWLNQNALTSLATTSFKRYLVQDNHAISSPFHNALGIVGVGFGIQGQSAGFRTAYINFTGIPYSSCQHFLTTRMPESLDIYINGRYLDGPTTPQIAQSMCNKGDTNDIAWDFY